MTDNEEFYDTVIAPELLKVGKLCKDHGISFVAIAEYDPGEYSSTVSLRENSSYILRLAKAVADCNGNVDSLFFAIMRHANTHGHQSLILKQLGIPETPDPK
jgi:hypothetical protein